MDGGDKVVVVDDVVVVVVAVVVVTAAKVVDVGALVVVVVVDVIVCCGDSVKLEEATTLLATFSRVSTTTVSAETKDSSVTSPTAGWTVSLTTVALTNLPRAPEIGTDDGERFSGNRLRINRTILVALGASALLTMGIAVVVVVVVVLVTSSLGLSCALNCS